MRCSAQLPDVAVRALRRDRRSCAAVPAHGGAAECGDLGAGGGHGGVGNGRVEAVVVDAVVRSINALSATVKGLKVELLGPEAKRFSFLPGMWVDFYIPSIDKVGGYSIVSLPEELPLLELAVKVSRHPPAAWIGVQAKPGDRVVIRAGGTFHLGDILEAAEGQTRRKPPQRHPPPEVVDHLLFVAGGIGVNPVYAMARQWAALISRGSTAPRRLTLAYSARSAGELIFLPELRALRGAVGGDRMRLSLHVTRENAEEAQRTRICAESLATLLGSEGDVVGTLCCVCGPPAMTDEVSAHLGAFGCNRGQIRAERWW